jgi:hypothetical protein
MPQIVFDILNILAALLRLLGMAVFGYGTAMLALEIFRKGLQVWMVQVAVFLGFLGIAIAFAVYVAAGGFGGFVLGAGVGLFMGLQGIGKKPKEEEEPEKKKK